jgi:hypothetical protein
VAFEFASDLAQDPIALPGKPIVGRHYPVAGSGVR